MKDLGVLENLIVGRVEPHIYAFTTKTVPNYLKVGDTYRPVAIRLKEWKQVYPELEQCFEDKAKVSEDVYFRDYSVHHFLESEKGLHRLQSAELDTGVYFSKEFFRDASAEDVAQAIADIKDDYNNRTNKYQFYNAQTQLPTSIRYASTGLWTPRPNQQETINAFKTAIEKGRSHLLMYAVMRFGKSFTSMCCATAMDASVVVVVSAKADVMEEWKKTVESAENFAAYDFISPDDLRSNYSIVSDTLNHPERPKKVVVFLTLQDLQGSDIKEKHQQIFEQQVDLLIVDETHFGARAEKYGAVLRDVKDVKEKTSEEESYTLEDAVEEVKTFDAKVTLHLSGTPYRILMGGEFEQDDIIAFYQFTDIVKEQETWDLENLTSDDVHEWDNPYYGFPQMIRFAFNPNESARKRLEELRQSGTTYAFSSLFKPQSIKKSADDSHKKFVFEAEILDLLKVIDGSKEDSELLGFLDYSKIKDGKMCRHIVCVLPYCASCDALEALIKAHSDEFKNLSTYEIINISGVDNQNAYKTPKDIKKRIIDCEVEGKKTLTLTVNRMLTGSTVEQWDTMLYLKDTSSPQEYDQAIFRLQNQYIKSYVNGTGEAIKYNMKPQTLLVDFDPNRVFFMQEQKAQIYNVNVDEAGNTKLSERISEELRISPIIVMNKEKIQQVEAVDILRAVSEYSRNRGVAEETLEIPVDLSLMGIATIREAIERENELGSKAGLTINGAEGDGSELDFSETSESSETPSEASGAQAPETQATSSTEESEKDTTKDIVKQFRSYYARILFFAFLTQDVVMSLNDILAQIDTPNNARIAHNIGLNKSVLKSINDNSDKFMLRKLDYKVQNLNQLSHDENLNTIDRASVAVQKFSKLGESEVITPRKICDEMVSLIPAEGLKSVIDNGYKILDIAGKAGEFALSICEKYATLGYDINALKNSIYTIPTSGLTYEFTRMIYEILGLNVDNIACKISTYKLLDVCDDATGSIDYEKAANLLLQNKAFKTIAITDELAAEGDEKVHFDVVIGNPPYQVMDGGNKASASPIYNHFVKIAKNMNARYISMIMPAKWYSGGKGLDLFRADMLNDNHICKLVDYTNSIDCFPNVDIAGGVCYFLRDTSYTGDCEYSNTLNGKSTTITRPLNKHDILIRYPMADNIISKVVQLGENTLQSRVTTRKPFGLATNCKPEETGDLSLRYNGGIGRYHRDKIKTGKEMIDEWKVIISYLTAEHAGQPDKNGKFRVLSTIEILPPMSICTETYLVAGSFKTEQEAKNYEAYLKTNFVRFLIGQVAVSQHITKNCFRFVPEQDYTTNWTDEALYRKYGLGEEEISFIESIIKPIN